MAGTMGDSLKNECTSLDQSGPTCIQDLPVEIQVVILKMRPPTEYGNITQVCQLWEKIVHRSIGVAVRISTPTVAKTTQNLMGFEFELDFDENGNTAPKPFPETVDAQRLAEIGIMICKFDEVRNIIIPPFKYPFLLQDLKFKRFISYNNFSRIMAQEYRKLTKLSISQKTLYTLELSTVSMRLPALKKLRVTGAKQLRRAYHQADTTRRAEAPIILNNFMSLMNKDFPCIRSFKAQIPAVHHKDATVLISILNFFARHKPTLKILRISYDEAHDIRPRERSRPRRNQGPPVEPDEIQEAFDFEKLKNNILEKLCFDFNRHATLHIAILVNRIRNMVSSCSALRILEFSHGLHTSAELNTWELPTTLKMLKLDFKRGPAPVPPQNPNFEFNLDILQNCSVLKKLQLNITTRLSRIINGKSLPKSLEHVDIRKFKVASNDCAYIVTELPKLRKFTFRNIGTAGGFGFNPQTLFDIVLARRFLKVYIYRGISSDHMPITIPQGNPAAAELHRFFSGASNRQALRIGWIAQRAAYRLIAVDLNMDLEMEEMDMDMEGEEFDGFDDDFGNDDDFGDDDDLPADGDDVADEDDMDEPNGVEALDEDNIDAPNGDGVVEEDDLDGGNDDVNTDEDDLDVSDDIEDPIVGGGDGAHFEMLGGAEVPMDDGAIDASVVDTDKDMETMDS